MSIKHPIVVYTFLWIGFVMGISFLETPLKFRPPNITLALEMGIVSLVFGFALLILRIQTLCYLCSTTTPKCLFGTRPYRTHSCIFIMWESKSQKSPA